MPGVFISRGMTLTIPDGGLILSIDPEGKTDSSLTLHVHFDVCPTWCQLALQHLEKARQAREERVAAWSANNEELKGKTLEREFEASMQAIMAAAVALEAFYAVVQQSVQLPPSLVDRWRNGRTARYSQITEVLRRAFKLKPKGVAVLRQNLREIYKFRDLAIHPSGKIEAPVHHPELDVGVEWRFAYFRATNAEGIVMAATAIVCDLAVNGKPADKKVQNYMKNLRDRLVEMFPDGHPNVKAKEQAP